ncbi:MAG: fido (protein-threonine AMPylation protein), partial [Gammaproteobacteria bacterium]
MPDELKKIIPGNTPLTDEDLEGLLLPHITTKGELNEIEQQNITDAEVKYFSKKYKPDDLLNWKFMRELHKDMLGHVWDWAGTQRIRETTIGIDPAYIMAEF